MPFHVKTSCVVNCRLP